MSKKYYRFFGGLLTAQEHWLNKMSEKGYRLIRAEKMLYEFEECKPDQVKYCVEFIGQKSKANASDYHEFLEGMGYKVFYKNINLNFVSGMTIEQTFERTEDGTRIITKDDINVDFKLTEKSKGMYARRLNIYSNHSFLPPEDDGIFKESAPVITLQNAYKQPEDFWDLNRPEEAGKRNQNDALRANRTASAIHR